MQRLHKIFLLIISSFSFFSLSSQNEFSKWYFGNQAGLDFSTSPPTVLTNGIMNATEGCATVCDVNGNLLFYTDGWSGIGNSNHAVMANGTGLLGGGSSTQSSMIVKQPGNNNIYFLFTTDATGAPNGLRYSIVDMSLAAGLGSVTAKNIPLYSPTCEKQVVVRHCNGRDTWIVTHDYNSSQFRSFLLNNTGVVMPAVISVIGETPAGTGNAAIVAIGQLKVSPDGKKLAMATASMSVPQSLGIGGFHLFDFDASSGVVSNSLTLIPTNNLLQNAYGVEFSPDGSKLYGTTSCITLGTNTCSLFQWNICASNNSAIIASQYSISLNGLSQVGSIQRAIDGKLYVAAAGPQSLSVINNPNSSGAAMNFVLNGQSVAPKQSRFGLPNYINSYVKTPAAPFTNIVACQTASFSVPPIPTFSSGCSLTPYAPSSYLWDFGEPTSGSTNSSTLTNPVHTYSTTGTYSVTLILYSNCTNDTLRKTITVTTLEPTLSVSGMFDICKGDKRTYTVTGATSYQWSNNTGATTATLLPATTTVFSVTGYSNSCSSSKSFTVNVNPCLGIAVNEQGNDLRIFPNPVKDLLSVESVNPVTVMIYDMNGTLVLVTKLNAGRNDINTSPLKPGVYSIISTSDKAAGHGKIVKME